MQPQVCLRGVPGVRTSKIWYTVPQFMRLVVNLKKIQLSFTSILGDKSNILHNWVFDKFSFFKKWKIKLSGRTPQWSVLRTLMGWTFPSTNKKLLGYVFLITTSYEMDHPVRFNVSLPTNIASIFTLILTFCDVTRRHVWSDTCLPAYCQFRSLHLQTFTYSKQGGHTICNGGTVQCDVEPWITRP